jgi:hypothetical protein
MKYIIFTMLCLHCSAILWAQDEEPARQQQVYGELAGSSVMFSFNYDMRFKKGTHLGWGLRAGMGLTFNPSGNEEQYYPDPYAGYYNGEVHTVYNIPAGINYIFGKPKSPNTFEVGVGATLLLSETSLLNYKSHQKENRMMGFCNFMYRRQPLNKGVCWRIGFTPILNTAGDMVPYAGTSIGYCF